jgi:hypothetical protein
MAKEERTNKQTQPTPRRRGRQGSANVPICHCGEPARARHSEPYFTRYYCKAGACNFSAKVARPDLQARLRRDDASGGPNVNARPDD